MGDELVGLIPTVTTAGIALAFTKTALGEAKTTRTKKTKKKKTTKKPTGPGTQFW